MTPREWLNEVATARRAAKPLRGVVQPGLILGYGSAPLAAWLAILSATGLLVFEGFDLVRISIAGALGVFVWLTGWPFVIIVTGRGVCSRRGYVRFDRIVAAGWASTGDRMIPFAESFVPVLVVVGDSGDLRWWPLAEVRRGALSSNEMRRERLLRRLVGAQTVECIPIPSDAAPSLGWPWGA